MQINCYFEDFKNAQNSVNSAEKFNITFRPTEQLLVTCPKPNRKSAIFYSVLILGIQMITTKQEVAVHGRINTGHTVFLNCLHTNTST